MRQDLDPGSTTFTCARLPDGRVGARITGWNRPVRDDVLDTHPHGTIDMHEGLVHSCNAYFAQLAVSSGRSRCSTTAGRLGISLTPASDAAAQRVRETLPQVGYGQGDVVATPLRMARVAAAVASNGVLRDARWEQDGHGEPRANRSVPGRRRRARLLGGYMRDVVLSGTGRSLRESPGRIAGKTGTAEVRRRPSHGWFVGFRAVSVRPGRRIAFAIIIENAGYGGAQRGAGRRRNRHRGHGARACSKSD